MAAYGRTIIYGSGNAAEADAKEKVPAAEEEAKPDVMEENARKMLSNPLTAPLALPALPALILAALQRGGGISSPSPPRDFSPRGAVVQTMSSKELSNKNFFGAGGSS